MNWKIKKILKKIKTTKTLVISLNNSKQFDNNLINIRAICHPMRINSSLNYLKYYNGPLLIPYSCLSSEIRKLFKFKNIIDYGISINKNISINANYISLNSLALIYSIGYLISKSFKRVYFAGFDGYQKIHLIKILLRNFWMILKKYKTKK